MTRQVRGIAIGIVVLAALLRFVQLDGVPYGVNVDEAGRAYDAYSLLHTGMDQHGNRWPLTLESYSKKNDNASAISAYAAIPTTAVFGPGVLAVRIPSAIAGVLAVVATFFLGWQVSSRWRVGLLASFALAVSPWHLTLSRTGHEAVWLPTLFLLGLVALLAARRRAWFLPFVALCWGLGFYGYGPGKVFFPLAGLLCLIFFFRQLQWKKFPLAVTVLLLAAFALPLVHFSKGQLGATHFQEISLFSMGWAHGLWRFAQNVFLYVTPTGWLGGKFTVGPIDWLVALIGLPLFYMAVRKHPQTPSPRAFVGLLLIIAVLPAVIADWNPHQLRAAALIGLIHIAGAWGIISTIDLVALKKITEQTRALAIAIVLALSLVGVYLFWQPLYALRHGYARATPAYAPEVQRLVQTLEYKYASAPAVYINDTGLNQPQIFFMLFRPWDVHTLGTDLDYYVKEAGWNRTTRLGRYHFCDLATECPTQIPGAVYVQIGRDIHMGSQLMERIPIRGILAPGIWWVISSNTPSP